MIAVLIIAGLIVYGTLYPWSFHPNAYASASRLLRSFPALTPRVIVDAVTNVAIYVPLGLTLYAWLRPMTGRPAGWILTVASSFALSFTLEYAQFFQATRFPNALDIVTNTVGGGLGALAGGAWTRLSSALRRPSYGALLLWICWITSLLFPLIPALGGYSLRTKLTNFLVFDSRAVLGYALEWLIAATLLARRKPHWVGATFLLIPAQLFFVGRQPTAGMLVGAASGSALAFMLGSARLTAACAVALLILWQLSPFRFGPLHEFSWLPFADALESPRASSVAMLLSKAFISAGTIALLVRGGVTFALAAAAVVSVLAGTEWMQTGIEGRTPSSTDPLIALLVAAILARSRGRL